MSPVARDLPCPVCGHLGSMDLSHLATKFADGTERWGRCHACTSCGVLRFYDAAKPTEFEGTIGSESADPTAPS